MKCPRSVQFYNFKDIYQLKSNLHEKLEALFIENNEIYFTRLLLYNFIIFMFHECK